MPTEAVDVWGDDLAGALGFATWDLRWVLAELTQHERVAHEPGADDRDRIAYLLRHLTITARDVLDGPLRHETEQHAAFLAADAAATG